MLVGNYRAHIVCSIFSSTQSSLYRHPNTVISVSFYVYVRRDVTEGKLRSIMRG
jgi:hypothetical protein